MEELCNVLTPELAYEAYSVFARYFGESFMQRSLVNLDFIQQLCALYREERQLSSHSKSGENLDRILRIFIHMLDLLINSCVFYECVDIKDGIKVLEEFDGSQATVSGNKIHFQVGQLFCSKNDV